MNKVDSLGLSLVLPVCPTLFLPRCLEGKTEQMLMAAAALASLQDSLGWTGADRILGPAAGPLWPPASTLSSTFRWENCFTVLVENARPEEWKPERSPSR